MPSQEPEDTNNSLNRQRNSHGPPTGKVSGLDKPAAVYHRPSDSPPNPHNNADQAISINLGTSQANRNSSNGSMRKNKRTSGPIHQTQMELPPQKVIMPAEYEQNSPSKLQQQRKRYPVKGMTPKVPAPGKGIVSITTVKRTEPVPFNSKYFHHNEKMDRFESQKLHEVLYTKSQVNANRQQLLPCAMGSGMGSGPTTPSTANQTKMKSSRKRPRTGIMSASAGRVTSAVFSPMSQGTTDVTATFDEER